MAEAQGLSDISTSPSRPGGTVAQRLRARHGKDFHPAQMPVAVDTGKFLGALTHKSNELANLGFAAPYKPEEWKKNDKTGALVHTGATAPHPDFMPPASVEYLKTDRRSLASAKHRGRT